MKTGSLFRGLSLLLILNLLVKPVWIFLIDRQVQNIVGHEEYGRYFSLLNLSIVLGFIADAGISNMLNQRMAARQPVHIRQLLRIKLLLTGLYLGASVWIAWTTGVSAWKYLVYVLLIQAMNSLFLFLRHIITARQRFMADAWLSVIDKLLMTLICGIIIYGSIADLHMHLELFLQIQLVATTIAVMSAAVVLRRYHTPRPALPEKLSLVLKRTLPFAAIILLMGVNYRLDGFLLDRLHPEGSLQAGIYAAAFRILDATNMTGYLTASFLVPFIARNQLDKSVLQATMRNATHGLIFFGIGISTFCLFYAPWIQQLLYHSADPYISTVLQWCLVSLPAYLLTHIYGSALVATGRFSPFITVLVISVLVSISLNFYLIPRYGALGSCIAALASQYLTALVLWRTALLRLNMSFDTRGAAMYIILACSLGLFFYLGKLMNLNVWLILALSALITSFLLARFSQLKNFLFTPYA